MLAVPAFVFANGGWARDTPAGVTAAGSQPSAAADVPVDFQWKIDAANANVSITGTDNHVLK
jgi:hypothetical protein